MKIPNIKDIVHSHGAQFTHYVDGEMWYQVLCADGRGTIFNFPVPVSDAEGGTFLATDKPVFFMRWIRRHLLTLESLAPLAAECGDES